MRWSIPNHRTGWFNWYAWYPVRVGNQYVWREYVECHITFGLFTRYIEYRNIGDSND